MRRAVRIPVAALKGGHRHKSSFCGASDAAAASLKDILRSKVASSRPQDQQDAIVLRRCCGIARLVPKDHPLERFPRKAPDALEELWSGRD